MNGMTSVPLSLPHSAAAELHRWTLDSYDGLRGLRASLRDVVGTVATPDPSWPTVDHSAPAGSACNSSGCSARGLVYDEGHETRLGELPA